ILAVDVVEAALGHAHVQRHLAAFEAGDGDAGARLLPLHPAAGGLALAGARAAADAHAALGGAFAGREFVELAHGPVPLLRDLAPREIPRDSADVKRVRGGRR